MTAGSAMLKAIAADYDQWERDVDPVTAGDEGDAAALFRLPDASPAAADARRTALFEFQRRLLPLKSIRLGDADSLNRDLLLRAVDDALQAAAFDPDRLPFTAYWSFSTFGESLARRTVIRSRLEADAYVARLTGLPGYYDQQIANARRGLVTGFIQPKLVAEVALRTARKQADVTLESSPLLLPLAHLPDSIPQDVQSDLRSRATAIVRCPLGP